MHRVDKPLIHIDILPWDSAAANSYGVLRANLRLSKPTIIPT
jgi:hypothetical protein